MVLFGAGNEGLPEQRIGQSKNFTGDRFVHYTSKTEFWFCRAKDAKLKCLNLSPTGIISIHTGHIYCFLSMCEPGLIVQGACRQHHWSEFYRPLQIWWWSWCGVDLWSTPIIYEFSGVEFSSKVLKDPCKTKISRITRSDTDLISSKHHHRSPHELVQKGTACLRYILHVIQCAQLQTTGRRNSRHDR